MHSYSLTNDIKGKNNFEAIHVPPVFSSVSKIWIYALQLNFICSDELLICVSTVCLVFHCANIQLLA